MQLLEQVMTSPTSLFKNFAGVILIQFSLLSLFYMVIPECNSVLQVLDTLVASGDLWWGLLSVFGGVVLVGDSTIQKCPLFLWAGYVCAFISFIALGCDFLLRRPPAMAGVIMAFTVALYLTGVAYVRFRSTEA